MIDVNDFYFDIVVCYVINIHSVRESGGGEPLLIYYAFLCLFIREVSGGG